MAYSGFSSGGNESIDFDSGFMLTPLNGAPTHYDPTQQFLFLSTGVGQVHLVGISARVLPGAPPPHSEDSFHLPAPPDASGRPQHYAISRSQTATGVYFASQNVLFNNSFGSGGSAMTVDKIVGAKGIDLVSTTAQLNLGGSTQDDRIRLFDAAGGNLFGNGGDDRLEGGTNDDDIYGEAGKDTILGIGGTNHLYGGVDNDIITGGTGTDYISGGAGDDNLNGFDGNDFFNGIGWTEKQLAETVTEDGFNIIQGWTGWDTVRYQDNAIRFDFKANFWKLFSGQGRSDQFNPTSNFYFMVERPGGTDVLAWDIEEAVFNGVSVKPKDLEGFAIISYLLGGFLSDMAPEFESMASAPPLDLLMTIREIRLKVYKSFVTKDVGRGFVVETFMTPIEHATSKFMEGVRALYFKGEITDQMVQKAGEWMALIKDEMKGRIDQKWDEILADPVSVLEATPFFFYAPFAREVYTFAKEAIERLIDNETKGLGMKIDDVGNLASPDISFSDIPSHFWRPAGLDAVQPPQPEPPIPLSLNGTPKADRVVASAKAEIIDTKGGHDTVYAKAGNDSIKGGNGNDRLHGEEDHDLLAGQLGNDFLSGGKGKDTFVFDTRLAKTNQSNKSYNFDKVADFNVKDDTFHLDNAVFKKLGKGTEAKPGQINKAYFQVGERADDRNDFIMFNKKTGVLSYDADGSGNGQAIEFAQIKKGLAITYKDFFVI
jgi:Ca2+-binding RTX toxin-like protein